MHPSTAARFSVRHPSLSSWGSLILAAAARAYLIFTLALAACALIPMIGGMTATVVHGTSMTPLVTEGDAVLSAEFTQEGPLPLGRVISFDAPTSSGRSGLILHRLVAANNDGTFSTAGDANDELDPWTIDRTDIVSVAHLLVPWVGLPSLWLESGSYPAFLLWVALTVATLAVEFVFDRHERQSAGRHQKTGRLAGASAIVLLGSVVGFGATTGPGAAAVFSGTTSSIGNTWTAAVTGPATRLVFATSPSSTTGGTPSATQPVVRVLNAAGDTKTGSRTITLAITTTAGAVLSCTANPLTQDTGNAAFAGCTVDKAGTYTLTASSGSLTPAVSKTFTVSPGPAARLVFTTSPSNASASAVFSAQPIVNVVDAGGNRVTAVTPVKIRLTSASGATLVCTTNPVNSTGGVVSYAGCRVNKAGTYTLTASSGSLPTRVSSAFVVTSAKPLTCNSQIWIATFSWTPTPYATTRYTLYVNGIAVQATGADGWNSYVQLTSNNVPASLFPAGDATVEVRKILSDGTEQVIGTGAATLGPAGFRTYTCG